MARRSFMPVVGVVENMSGFTTENGRHYDLFGKGGGEELAAGLGVPLIGQIPLDPESGELVPGDVLDQTCRVLDNLSTHKPKHDR